MTFYDIGNATGWNDPRLFREAIETAKARGLTDLAEAIERRRDNATDEHASAMRVFAQDAHDQADKITEQEMWDLIALSEIR